MSTSDSSSSSSSSFRLASPELRDGGTLPMSCVHNVMGATGENVSPALNWQGAPEGTKSFALTMYDPDAPTGSGWWHWVVYDIPATANALPRGAGAADGQQLPAGARQGRTDFGTAGYGGAAPPPGHGPHRYIFTLHALSTDKLDVPADASAALVGFMIHASKLASTTLTCTYER